MTSFKLEQRLRKYAASGAVPMHMPGHKRNGSFFALRDAEQIDITEIHGFDDLHDPEGILKESQDAAAALCGADRTFYLVNGSTAGILAGISACTKPHDRILMARNCHLSAYNAVILGALRPSYLTPPSHPAYGFAGSIRPEDVRAALGMAFAENDPFTVVVITSPTYEGVVSDVAAIAEICHGYGIPLVVDEAHGAHLRTAAEERRVSKSGEKSSVPKGSDSMRGCLREALRFPVSAVAAGADIVIQSLHKTMPAPTQTGLLHCKGNIADPERIKKFLDIYQSSSPSYILMAGIENALRFREDPGWADAWLRNLERFYEKAGNLEALEVIPAGEEFPAVRPMGHADSANAPVCDDIREACPAFSKDPSKIVIAAGRTSYTGAELMSVLRTEYNIECEMAAGSYVIAMTGAGDTAENLDKLADALVAIDRRWMEKAVVCRGERTACDGAPEPHNSVTPGGAKIGGALSEGIIPERYILTPGEAFYAAQEWIPLEAAAGRTAHDIVTIYPPGIPLLVPGERITARHIDLIKKAGGAGLHVTGLRDEKREEISVVK